MIITAKPNAGRTCNACHAQATVMMMTAVQLDGKNHPTALTVDFCARHAKIAADKLQRHVTAVQRKTQKKGKGK